MQTNQISLDQDFMIFGLLSHIAESCTLFIKITIYMSYISKTATFINRLIYKISPHFYCCISILRSIRIFLNNLNFVLIHSHTILVFITNNFIYGYILIKKDITKNVQTILMKYPIVYLTN